MVQAIFSPQARNDPAYIQQLARQVFLLLQAVGSGGGGGGGSVDNAANLGSGAGVFATKIGTDLYFKSLIAGTNVTLTTTGNDITINATGGGGGGGNSYFPSGW